MRPQDLAKTLETLIPQRLPVLIKGAPGIGKTDIIKQVCAKIDADLLIGHPVVDNPTDYKGLPCFVDGEARFLPIGNLKQLLTAKRLTVFFIDDLGQASPVVQAACMQLILERRINEHAISEHVVFIAATNRKEDRAGVSGILEPVKSRFVTIIELEPHRDDWCRWALEHGMPNELIAFIHFKPGLLFSFEPTADITNTPCPRTVAHAGHLYNLNLPPSIRYETISGAAGEGFAAEFEGYVRILMNLPDPRLVLKDPHKHKEEVLKSSEPSVRHALVVALAEHVELGSMDAYMEVLSWLPPEFGVLSVTLAIRRDKGLKHCAAFNKFLVDNHEFIF